MKNRFSVIQSTGYDWKPKYRRFLFISDFLLIFTTILLAQNFGISPTYKFVVRYSGDFLYVNYLIISLFLILLWNLFLYFFGARQLSILGSGSEEYRRVVNATLFFFGFLAVFAYLTKSDLGRAYFLIALPIGTLLLLVGRWSWRSWLRNSRKSGSNFSKAILIGSKKSTSIVRNELSKNPDSGLVVAEVIALNFAKNSNTYFSTEKARLQTVETVKNILLETSSDTVIVTSSEPELISLVTTLSWALDPQTFNIVVSPNLLGFSGPRIHVRPTAGMPLFYLEAPRLSAVDKFIKRVFDLFVTVLILIPLIPFFVVVAIGIKLSSRGPIFYTQERIGISGRPFKMYKFRSMKPDADLELSTLLSQQTNNGDKPLFKISNDPRITKFGKFIRKYSIDELPQLLNVLNGTMSLVGPRPQRQAEVDLYKDNEYRRLAVQPGLTGLWQVNGRSALSWEQEIEFDLYYVENWTFVDDLVILFKTFRAVFLPGETAH